MANIGNIELGEFPLLLAPMEDVSDPPFRHLCKQQGADVVLTEFISSEGLIRNAPNSTQKLDISKEERPVGIQIFGNDLAHMQRAAAIAERAGPDFIDINYGCPVKKVVSKGAGAGILKDLPKMIKMTQAVVNCTSRPVTVKTRLGWDDESKFIVNTAEALQDAGISAITIHGRTRMQMFKGKADWTLIGAVKDNPRMRIPVFGNGDICNAEKALEAKHKYGVDGIMIGRGAIGNPWIFREIRHYLNTGKHLPPPTLQEKAEMARLHLLKSVEWKGEKRGVFEMRKHYAGYFKGIPQFKRMRLKLVSSEDTSELIALLNSIPGKYRTAVSETLH